MRARAARLPHLSPPEDLVRRGLKELSGGENPLIPLFRSGHTGNMGLAQKDDDSDLEARAARRMGERRTEKRRAG